MGLLKEMPGPVESVAESNSPTGPGQGRAKRGKFGRAGLVKEAQTMLDARTGPTNDFFLKARRSSLRYPFTARKIPSILRTARTVCAAALLSCLLR